MSNAIIPASNPAPHRRNGLPRHERRRHALHALAAAIVGQPALQLQLRQHRRPGQLHGLLPLYTRAQEDSGWVEVSLTEATPGPEHGIKQTYYSLHEPAHAAPAPFLAPAKALALPELAALIAPPAALPQPVWPQMAAAAAAAVLLAGAPAGSAAPLGVAARLAAAGNLHPVRAHTVKREGGGAAASRTCSPLTICPDSRPHTQL